MTNHTQALTSPNLVYDPRKNHMNLASEGQCDCGACAIASPALSVQKSLSQIINYKLPDQSVITPLSDDQYAIFTPQAGAIVLNQSAFEMVNFFRTVHTFNSVPLAWSEKWGRENIQSILAQMAEINLITPPENNISWSPNKHTLIAWLHITDHCNMRCDYCYLPHQSIDMSEKTAKLAIEATFRSALCHNYHRVKFKYAGGEPLLRFPFIIQQHLYAQQLAHQHSLELEGVILSNATLLTIDMIKTIKKLNLHLMISLDGLGYFHDIQRTFANGQQSSYQVIHAIDLALKNGLVPNISITISGKNVNGLPELIDWILEHDLPFNINFYRQNEIVIGHDDLQLKNDQIIANLLNAYKIVEKYLPKQSLLNSLANRANLSIPHLRPCSVGNHYIVFNAEGKVAKCQMQMNNTIADVSEEDPLLLIQNDEIGVQNPSVEDKMECRSCQWAYWCAGGCPLSAYRMTGQYDTKSPNCRIYKAIYPEIIRLEGLRLLKYFGNTVQS